MATPTSNTNGEQAQQHSTHTFNFCSECSNMLYPEEDIETHKLYYKCRTCNYSELASSLRVMHNELNTSAGETAGVTQDVGSDPTVSEKKSPFVRIPSLDFIHPEPEEDLAMEAAVFKTWAKDKLAYGITDAAETTASANGGLRRLGEWKRIGNPPTPDSGDDHVLSVVRQSTADVPMTDSVFPGSTPPASSSSSADDADDDIMGEAEEDEDEDLEGDVTDDEERAIIADPHVQLFGYETRSGRRVFKCKGRDGLYREM